MCVCMQIRRACTARSGRSGTDLKHLVCHIRNADSRYNKRTYSMRILLGVPPSYGREQFDKLQRHYCQFVYTPVNTGPASCTSLLEYSCVCWMHKSWKGMRLKRTPNDGNVRLPINMWLILTWLMRVAASLAVRCLLIFFLNRSILTSDKQYPILICYCLIYSIKNLILYLFR